MWLECQSNYNVAVVNKSDNRNGVVLLGESTPPLILNAADVLGSLLDHNLVGGNDVHFVSKPLEDQSVSKSETSSDGFDIYRPSKIKSEEISYQEHQETMGIDKDFSINNSVFGSPLKMEKIADLTSSSGRGSVTSGQRNFVSKGLDLSSQIALPEARKVVQSFHKAKDMNESMVSVLCNAQDTKRTLMIGANKKIVGNHHMVTSVVLTVDETKLTSLEEERLQRSKAVKSFEMKAQYELLDPSLGLGSIILTARWSDAKGGFEISQPLSTEFSLSWNTKTGNEQSPVFHLYKELQQVSKFGQLLIDDKQNEICQSSNEESTDEVLRKLNIMFAKSRSTEWDSQDLNNSLSVSTMVDGLDIGVGMGRLDLGFKAKDFTDELYGLLVDQNLCDIVTCLKATFEKLQVEAHYLYLHKDNRCTLANLVRAAASGLAVFPEVSTELAVRLITEAGVERMRKVFHTLMVVKNSLCTQAQFDEIYLPRGSNFGTKATTELFSKLTSLQKLHHCLESVAIIDAWTENQDLPRIAGIIMKGGQDINGSQCGDVNLMPVSAAVALPELKKHAWTSMRRESSVNGVVTVETLFHQMPDGLLDIVPLDTGSVLKFTARHSTVDLGPVSQ